LVCTARAAALVTAGQRLGVVAQVRGYAAAAAEAVFDAAALPAGFGQWLYGAYLDREELLRRNAQLRRTNVLLRAQLPRHEFLEQENRRLRRLLLDADGGPAVALFAELAPVNLSRSAEQKIILSRGRADNVFPGQLALDAFGVVGQVTAAGLRKSTVTLLTDSSHSVPVQVARNGLQAVVDGGGVRGALSVPHLSQQADIKEGDLLVTSGLGRRFPAGHPVARVVVPRFVAGVLAVPILTLLFNVVGVLGGYYVGTVQLGVDSGVYWASMQNGVDVFEDIGNGIIKSFVFGFVVSWIMVFEGCDTEPTAEGISRATTRTVVVGSLSVLGLDYILTALMYGGIS